MNTTQPSSDDYLDNTGRNDVLSGGVTLIPIDTPKGTFRVWTKRVGNTPTMKLLLLHGGPGMTHEYFEACDSYPARSGNRVLLLRPARVGVQRSARRARPVGGRPRSSTRSSRCDEALASVRDNFYLYGQSWGGILAIEYALAYQRQLKGLIVSNMMASIPAYNAYARSVLMPAMDQEALVEIMRLEAAGGHCETRATRSC